MKLLLTFSILTLCLSAPRAYADTEVPIDDDPMFAEMTGEGQASDGGAEDLDNSEGSLEQAAERFHQVCFENLGPASSCFEDYETQACVDQRISCRRAGHYSR